MDTPNKDTMVKLAAMEKGAATINRLIVDNLRNYSELNIAVQDFLSDPGEEKGNSLDECFAACEKGFESIRAAVANVAVIAMDADTTDEDGKLAVGGVEDQDGIRLG